MRNIRLTIRYDGTRYSGWQFQKNAKTIQEIIEERLKKIIGEKVSIVASGRTDAGVHAEAQVANFKTRSRIALKNLQMALNSALPKDIVITGAEEADIKFNSQRDAKSKLYRYTIMNDDYLDPLIRHFAAKCFFKLDVKAMRKGARHLLGGHDFKTFQTNDGNGHNRSSFRTIRKIKIEKDDKLIYIYVEADSFLYNMVRNIVGTLIEVGRGKFEAEVVKDILSKRNRRFCGPTAAAKGLCLVKVNY